MAYYVGEAIALSNWTGPSATPTGGYRNASGTLYEPTTPALRRGCAVNADKLRLWFSA